MVLPATKTNENVSPFRVGAKAPSQSFCGPNTHTYFENYDYESFQYFYHPDHLGSSSFITDMYGYAEQHIQYLPFGELFVNQQNTSFDTRYKFTAKPACRRGREHDQESNYTYFGARYYDSDLSVWLSVDPMADKYPNLSPYNYCSNSPIIMIDPDGRDNITFMDDGSIQRKKTDDKFDILYNQNKDMSQRIDFKDGKSQIGELQGININGKETQFMTIADDNIATSVFEFAASTTFNSTSNAEFGLQKFSFNDGFSMNVVQSGEISAKGYANVTPLGQFGEIDLGGGHFIGNASSWDIEIHSHPGNFACLVPSGFARRLDKNGKPYFIEYGGGDRTFRNTRGSLNPTKSYVYGWNFDEKGPVYIKYDSKNAEIVGRNRK